jgi:hypothetical protein
MTMIVMPQCDDDLLLVWLLPCVAAAADTSGSKVELLTIVSLLTWTVQQFSQQCVAPT